MFDLYLLNEARSIFEKVIHVSRKELVIIAPDNIFVVDNNEELERIVFDYSLPF